MLAFDTSFLIDYLDGVPAAGEFVEQHRDRPLHTPALALFEVYRGGARTGGRAHVERVRDALEWVDPLPLDDAAAEEAALVEAELLDAGRPINLGDILIAGICRHHGADLVTRDGHFEQVDGLTVVAY
ncbi:PIN domain-containing protein [Natronomonas sp. EA1]|uniref:PIN domain-containing protein n=1 Tax=Natronomonas sp. EA1 TaxID=3421655 RepID=UPI003EBDA17F